MAIKSEKIILAKKIINNWLSEKAKTGSFGSFYFSAAINGKSILTGGHDYLNNSFRLASVSKIFTIILLLKLEKEKNISLGDEVSKYLPFIKRKNLTLRDLMNHDSGIARDGQFAFWDDGIFPTKEDIGNLDKSAFKKLTSKFKYSNLGYALLGMAIEDVWKKPYLDGLNSEVLSPLGIKVSANGKGSVKGLFKKDGVIMADDNFNVDTNAFLPSLGIIISPEGLARLIEFISNSAKLKKFIGDRGVKEFFNKETNKFETWKNSKRNIFGRGGDFFGSSADIFFDPKNGISGALVSNVRRAELSAISDGILRTFYAIIDDRTFSGKTPFGNYEGIYRSGSFDLIIIGLKKGLLLFDPQANSPFRDGMIGEKNDKGELILQFSSSSAEMKEPLFFVKENDKTVLKLGSMRYIRVAKLID